MEKPKFEKNYGVICKDPKGQEILERNFHFFKLKSTEEQMRVIRRNFGSNVYVKEE